MPTKKSGPVKGSKEWKARVTAVAKDPQNISDLRKSAIYSKGMQNMNKLIDRMLMKAEEFAEKPKRKKVPKEETMKKYTEKRKNQEISKRY